MFNSQEILNIFSERLKELIDDKGLDITKFSKEIKIPRTTINGWILKQRMPKIDVLYRIAFFFNVSSDYLLGLES